VVVDEWWKRHHPRTLRRVGRPPPLTEAEVLTLAILAHWPRFRSERLVEPSTRETFMPRELAEAYKKFLASEPRYLDAQSGIEGAVYRFGTRVLVVYEEPETGLVVLIHPTS
jgi:hypothetical protein